ALSQQHKHLKEMAAICSLEQFPVFCPIVGDFFSGMEATVPLFSKDLRGSMEDVQELYRSYYKTGLVFPDGSTDDDGMLSAAAYSGRDDMQISVLGNRERILLTARFDNLGKGASGAAIQNMNILMGLEENTGLSLK
ncbi:MAG: N-acetyl-gamma-glutamyl-phosphate reductase, partial [Oscillospiraceae bacterium]|nr:N-acetyl-gamma-glutamyl-phosphate reductase [Oscillospiraceae bacterium]